MIKAFEIFNKFSDEFWTMIDLMKNSDLPCFYGFDIDVFKSRFHRFCSDDEREKLVTSLID